MRPQLDALSSAPFRRDTVRIGVHCAVVIWRGSMELVLGIAVALAVIWAAVKVGRLVRRTGEVAQTALQPVPERPMRPAPRHSIAAPVRPPGPPAVPSPSVSPRDVGHTIGGWLLGHQIEHGRHGFPGDPLPGGHLGAPADLAFWGSILDDDPDDPDF
jgi:hypothetical protein